MEEAINFREMCGHFRVLIIGRANAGKTTILKKVCNTTDEPRIYDPNQMIDKPLALVEPSAQRGLHDINNQLVFASNPQFIFHDSRGFEAGGVDEVETVKAFIDKRAKMTSMKDQLHAIWYCVPTDSARPSLAADKVFFEECGTGKVPVIAIFTKIDALVSSAYNTLREDQGYSRRNAKLQAPAAADDILKKDYINPLLAAKHRPVKHVCLNNMQTDDSDCSELINETADAMDDDRLKLLFVTVQQNNLDLCIKLALSRSIFPSLDEVGRDQIDVEKLLVHVLSWFPHVWNEKVGV